VPTTVIIEPPRRGLSLGLADIWRHRELLGFLMVRDLTVRYRQTAIGVAWVVLQPLLTVAVFTILFGRVMSVPSDGLPYVVFALTGLLPWMFFSKVVTQSTQSVVASANLITKVYFPRMIIPASAVGAGLVDTAVGLVVLAAAVLVYGVKVSLLGIVLWPLLMLAVAGISLGLSFWLSGLNVRFRDIAAVVPLVMQLWMFATPVIYPASLVPERWRMLLWLNPLSGVFDTMRAVLFGLPIHWDGLAMSLGLGLLLLVSGAMAFKRLESAFADII
jgi:lipopolysaccharide transport system permease protein